MRQNPRAADREMLEAQAKDNLGWLADFNPVGKRQSRENCDARLAQCDGAALKMLIHHTRKALEILGE